MDAAAHPNASIRGQEANSLTSAVRPRARGAVDATEEPEARGDNARHGGEESAVMTNVPLRAAYPTPAHERAAQAVVAVFSGLTGSEAVILTGSCARGKATRDSCLDIVVLACSEIDRKGRRALEAQWERAYQTDVAFAELRSAGRYSHVDLEITDGRFVEHPRGWTSGPDPFELQIGNTVAYAVPLWQRGDEFLRLRAKWQPYYDEECSTRRLAAAVGFAQNNLDHVPLYVGRCLYFQAFHRLYHAFQEFLQALFIARRTYPIAYDKWIREQVQEILGLPQLYRELPTLFEYRRFESDELIGKAKRLERLLREYTSA